MSTKTIIALVVILVIAGGAYFLLQDELLTPEQEVLSAMKNTKEADSLTMDLEINANMVEDGEEVSFVLGMLSDIDRREEGSMSSDINGEVVAEGMAVNFGGGLTYADDNLYARVDTFPSVLFPDLPQEISDLIGVEILVVEEVSEKVEEGLEETDEELARMFKEEGVDPMTMKELMEELEGIFDKALEEGVVEVTEVESDEIEGERATKYTVLVNYEKVPDFVLEVVEEHEEIFPGIDKEEVEESMEQLKEEIEETEDLEKMEFYIWTDGRYVIKAQFSQDLEEELSLEVIVRFKNFNEDFDITAPEEFMTLEEVEEIFMEMLHPFGPAPMPDFEIEEDITEDEIIIDDIEEIEEEMDGIEDIEDIENIL